jgi:hypothetical protein
MASQLPQFSPDEARHLACLAAAVIIRRMRGKDPDVRRVEHSCAAGLGMGNVQCEAPQRIRRRAMAPRR